jgi:acyl dehydratase
MLLHRRGGLRSPEDMPQIARSTGPVKLNAHWLGAYRELIGLSAEDGAVLPPLALQLAAAPLHLDILANPRFPFKAMGLVHVGQRVDQGGPILPGAVLRLEAYTGQAFPARRGTQFELITEARRDNKLVWRSVTLVLARHPVHNETTLSGPTSSLVSEVPIEPQFWLRRGIVPAPENLGRRYAAIAGDWNPIHQRAWLARPFGFDRAIVHGTWTLARALVAAGWPLHEAFSMHAQFRKPVPLPSAMAVWVHRGASLHTLRVTDDESSVEHLTARIEPALAWGE